MVLLGLGILARQRIIKGAKLYNDVVKGAFNVDLTADAEPIAGTN